MCAADYVEIGAAAVAEAQVLRRARAKWVCLGVVALTLVLALVTLLLALRPWETVGRTEAAFD